MRVEFDWIFYLFSRPSFRRASVARKYPTTQTIFIHVYNFMAVNIMQINLLVVERPHLSGLLPYALPFSGSF